MILHDALQRTLSHWHVQPPSPAEADDWRKLTLQVLVVAACFGLMALFVWLMAQVPPLAP